MEDRKFKTDAQKRQLNRILNSEEPSSSSRTFDPPQSSNKNFHDDSGFINQLLELKTKKPEYFNPYNPIGQNNTGLPLNDQKNKLPASQNPDGIQYEFDGPLFINDSVHENITLKSLQKVGLANEDDKIFSESVWEFMRGVIWNDDPEALLFDHNYLVNFDWSSGMKWVARFRNGEKKGENGVKMDKSNLNSNLTERSHFGDLQFIHGMASNDGELPEVTKEKVMLWAEFTYKVAIGEIPVNTKIPDIPLPEIVELFKNSSYTDHFIFEYEKPLALCTLHDFFHVHYFGNVQQRAIGSLLHLIQDSYARGHVERELIGENRYGAIKSFLSYSQQDHEKHGEADSWVGSESDSIDQRLSKVGGAPDAIDAGAVILNFYINKTKWDKVEEYLRNVIFILSPDITNAGPGGNFKK
jgi:hypothetical protein